MKHLLILENSAAPIFADRRYDHVFVYHNSAPSFYNGRGFRGSLGSNFAQKSAYL